MAIGNLNGMRLMNALTEYDRKQSTKRGYNRYALGQYCAAMQEVRIAVESGDTLRQALCANFCGRLLDVLLRSVGEETSTRDEQLARR